MPQSRKLREKQRRVEKVKRVAPPFCSRFLRKEGGDSDLEILTLCGAGAPARARRKWSGMQRAIPRKLLPGVSTGANPPHVRSIRSRLPPEPFAVSSRVFSLTRFRYRAARLGSATCSSCRLRPGSLAVCRRTSKPKIRKCVTSSGGTTAVTIKNAAPSIPG